MIQLHLVVLEGAARHRHLQIQAVAHPFGGKQATVAGIVDPAHAGIEHIVLVPIFADEIQKLLGRVLRCLQIGMLIIQAKAKCIVLIQWQTVVDSPAIDVGQIPGHVGVTGVGLAIEGAKTATDAIPGVIGIVVGEAVDGVDLAVVDGQAVRGPRSQKVVLGDAGIDQCPLRLRIADSGTEGARGLFRHAHLDIHLVGRPRHCGGLDVHLAKISQPVQAPP